MVTGIIDCDAGSQGAGGDVVTILGDAGDGPFAVVFMGLDEGDDSLTVGGAISPGAEIRFDDGDDTADIATNNANLYGQNGNDRLTVGVNYKVVDGGPGFDTCSVINGNPPRHCEAP